MVKHIIAQVNDIEHSEMLHAKGERTWLEVIKDGLNVIPGAKQKEEVKVVEDSVDSKNTSEIGYED